MAVFSAVTTRHSNRPRHGGVFYCPQETEMTPSAENALRSVARRCRDEILKAIDGRPKSEHDSISTALLNKHAQTIQCLPPDTFTAKR